MVPNIHLATLPLLSDQDPLPAPPQSRCRRLSTTRSTLARSPPRPAGRASENGGVSRSSARTWGISSLEVKTLLLSYVGSASAQNRFSGSFRASSRDFALINGGPPPLRGIPNRVKRP